MVKKEYQALGGKIADYWDDRSIGISLATRKSLDRENQNLERIIDDLDISQGTRVADMGTGCGFMAILFAKRGLKVTGIDMVDSMLEYARNITEETGLDIEFINRDV